MAKKVAKPRKRAIQKVVKRSARPKWDYQLPLSHDEAAALAIVLWQVGGTDDEGYPRGHISKLLRRLENLAYPGIEFDSLTEERRRGWEVRGSVYIEDTHA